MRRNDGGIQALEESIIITKVFNNQFHELLKTFVMHATGLGQRAARIEDRRFMLTILRSALIALPRVRERIFYRA